MNKISVIIPLAARISDKVVLVFIIYTKTK
jgi:hypothetical protein